MLRRRTSSSWLTVAQRNVVGSTSGSSRTSWPQASSRRNKAVTPARGISRAGPIKRGRPHRTRYSRRTDNAATSGRGPSRNRSQGVNGRGGRNVCMARLRARCAQGAAPAAAARGWADSVGRAWTWQPPRGEAGAVQQACTATPPDSCLPARPPRHQASWNNGQTPSGAASSGQRGRAISATTYGDQRSTRHTSNCTTSPRPNGSLSLLSNFPPRHVVALHSGPTPRHMASRNLIFSTSQAPSSTHGAGGHGPVPGRCFGAACFPVPARQVARST